MKEPVMVSDDMLREARLGGVACSAYAWVTSTEVEARPERKGRREMVPGVRTWRGRAIVTDARFLDRWRQSIRMVYEGVVRDGDEERPVRAEVFAYFLSHAKRPGAYHEGPESADFEIIVEFSGAGNLPAAY